MKELTKDEKIALLVEVNKLLATIPDYQLTMPVIEMEYADILITDQGYIKRLYLEYGEISEEFFATNFFAICSHGAVSGLVCKRSQILCSYRYS